MGIVSLQDIDLGIAMSHFAPTLQELGIKGKWLVSCQRYSVISKESSRLRNLRFLPAVEMTFLD